MKPPWHFWVTAIFALIWYANGAYDYILTKTENAEYFAQLTPIHIAYLKALPVWAGMAWALAVWGGVGGAILLLLRLRFAGVVFGVALLGVVGKLVYGFGLSEVVILAVLGPFATTFTLAIVLIPSGLWIYARQMTKARILQ